MVSQQTIKDYDFTDIYEYYNYIVTSGKNGQWEQVKNLINELSKEQKKDAIWYLCSVELNDFWSKTMQLIFDSI